jgi:hypothetical protein
MTNNIQSHIYYVYYYLRSVDSKVAKAGTPYYVGKGKGNRYLQDHKHIPVPKSMSNIIKVAENLTNDMAKNIEILHIAIHGRIDIGTGILRNRTKGGDGCKEPNAESRIKMGHARGGFWWHNGAQCVQAKKCPGPGWIRGVTRTARRTKAAKNAQMSAAIKVKGTCWWTNGDKSVRAVESPGPEWSLGNHTTVWNKGKKGHLYWWSNGSQYVQSYEQPGIEWFRSSPLANRPRTRDTGDSNHKGTCWWTNGVERKRAVESPGDGWYRGTGKVTRGSKGIKWWNNGIHTIFAKESPGPEWKNGRLKS